ncbi:MAG TPA: class I SAM-dependent methyltransferase [Chitinophagaceae bacterium]|nr:class I SAM-dependent methyltransferase [Chitinophagaceae bacterium]
MNFKKYARFYELFNQEKDYKAEVDYVLSLISQYAPGAKSLLELGAGTGKHAGILRANGFEVIGIERSAEMAGLARENGVECVVGDISKTDLEREFDVVVSLFHVISYLTDYQDLVNTFRLTNRHLKDGGIFIFDTWFTDAVEVQKPERREKLVEYEGFKIKRIAEPVNHPDQKLVEVAYKFSLVGPDELETDSWQETHPMRHFSISEIEVLAKSSGFELIRAEEFSSGAAPSAKTWGVCFILRKYNIS